MELIIRHGDVIDENRFFNSVTFSTIDWVQASKHLIYFLNRTFGMCRFLTNRKDSMLLLLLLLLISLSSLLYI